MKVRTYNSVPLKLDNPKALVEKIKKESDAAAVGSSEHVKGMYLLVGGRNGIEQVLNSVSGGAFVGEDLVAKMIRVNRKKLSKTVTVICVAPNRVWGGSGANGKWQKIASGQGSIPFSQIAGGMWGGEAKSMNDLLGAAGF
jgi:hypothetical protein